MSLGRRLVTPILGGFIVVQLVTTIAVLYAVQTTPVAVILAVGLLATFAAAVAAARLVDSNITRPLSAFAGELKRIGKGDYAPPALQPGTDAIGQLSRAMTTMTRQIADRENYIRDLALYEPITHLANRAAFLEAVMPQLTNSERGSMLVVGLARAQEIANTVGHDIADRMLRYAASVLIQLIPDAPLACLGDRSFAIFLRDSSEAKARDTATQIVTEFEAPYTDGDLTIDMAAAVGIALLPAHGDDGALMLRRAEVALQTALHSEHRWAIYDRALDPHRPERLSLMSELRQGLVAGEFTLAFQPKLHVRTGHIGGAEALVRWNHPRRGVLPTEEFVTLAEETGNIGHLTRWALRSGIAQAAKWRADGVNLQIAINISARDLGDARLPDNVSLMLAQQKLDPAAISLEVTESAIMADPTAAIAVLRRFTERGIGIALDDFGIGQASLAYLRTLPIREVKIDKTFVLRLADGDKDRKIVRSVIDLGHSLGFIVSVEGVEDARTMEVLAELGCDYAQGYHISRPLLADGFAQFLRQMPPPVSIVSAAT